MTGGENLLPVHTCSAEYNSKSNDYHVSGDWLTMKRMLIILLAPLLFLSGCGFWRIDTMHVLVRSDRITSLEQEQEIMSRAKLETTSDGRIRVLYVQGTPYERGYQHGKLLRREVQENLGYLYKQGLDTFHSEELFYEAWERLRPFVSQEYIDEMHGLAHGSKMPLHVIHAIHALPSMSEWSGKKRIKKVVKQMMSGELGTSCSNVCATGEATADDGMYVVRILDWGLHRISKLHKYPLITITIPETGYPSANIGWVGFLGSVSGMNSQGITLGEKGHGSPPNETLRGKPMIFLLRDILTYASSLSDVRDIIRGSAPTNSFVFLMTDGKTGEAELYIRDRDRFLVFQPGEDVADRDKNFEGIEHVVYGGHYDDRLTEVLEKQHGRLSPEVFMNEVIPYIAMKSNFQNVVYEPRKLHFWVSNASSRHDRAAEQPYTFFDFREALERFTAHQ